LYRSSACDHRSSLTRAGPFFHHKMTAKSLKADLCTRQTHVGFSPIPDIGIGSERSISRSHCLQRPWIAPCRRVKTNKSQQRPREMAKWPRQEDRERR
jgi:hypothetical protein